MHNFKKILINGKLSNLNYNYQWHQQHQLLIKFMIFLIHMLVLLLVAMLKVVQFFNHLSKLKNYLNIIVYKKYVKKALMFNKKEWFLMLDFKEILILNHNNNIILLCVSQQLENHILILLKSIDIDQLIAHKVLTQFIFITNNKIHKFLDINTQYLKIIKFILVILQTFRSILKKSKFLIDNYLYVKIVLDIHLINQKFIVLPKKHIFVMIVIKRFIRLLQLEKNIIKYKYHQDLKNLGTVQSMKTIFYNYIVLFVVKLYV